MEQSPTKQITACCASVLHGDDLRKSREVEVVKVKHSKETQGHTTVRRKLLTKCHWEFEKAKEDDKERERMLQIINEAKTAKEKQLGQGS